MRLGLDPCLEGKETYNSEAGISIHVKNQNYVDIHISTTSDFLVWAKY